MPHPTPQRPAIAVADRWDDYRLLDCGDGMKCERWGARVLVRPDPQILWPKSDPAPWRGCDALYHRDEKGGGRWEIRRPLPETWTLRYDPLDLVFRIRPTGFKHTGLFPEQAVNWHWFSEKIRAAGRPVSVLNLFGYTGAATCAAAKAGASVCHVDASAGMVRWCRDNAALCGLADAPVRYIADDCLKFARREHKRGRRYDAVIMDPPTYGRGSGGELWKLEDNLWELLTSCRDLLTDKPLFFLLNAYTARLSPTVAANLLAELLRPFGGQVAAGEVGLPVLSDGKILPCGIYGRWES
ncbi:MAG: class I SAM-dependent methyltransferase [Opitutaceae bacterium]|jgi:23S rRNA (cytosine1962-C5)-methyltransferase|nr:class I SAM-dependent methyltransferase [Opitutaceae bacterium]